MLECLHCVRRAVAGIPFVVDLRGAIRAVVARQNAVPLRPQRRVLHDDKVLPDLVQPGVQRRPPGWGLGDPRDLWRRGASTSPGYSRGRLSLRWHGYPGRGASSSGAAPGCGAVDVCRKVAGGRLLVPHEAGGAGLANQHSVYASVTIMR